MNAGKGRRPETWDTFVQCLESAELNAIADDVKEQFEDRPKPKGESNPIKFRNNHNKVVL